MATILTQEEHDTLRSALEYGRRLIGRVPENRQAAYAQFDKALSILEGVRGREGGELGECPKKGTGPNGGAVASEGDPLSSAPNVPFAPAHKAQYPQLDESGILLIFSEDEEDSLHIGELHRDIGVARETMAKCGRDVFGEFDFLCGPESTDVDQWYPVDNIKATIEAAHTMFDALYRQALAQTPNPSEDPSV